MSVEIRRFPMPGEPLAAYTKWVSTIPEFDHLSEKELKEVWKLRSARELIQSTRKYCDKDLERYVDPVTLREPREALSKYIGISSVKLEYHYFN